MGIGGGTISKESEAKYVVLKRGRELLEKNDPERALPFMMKAIEDPNNLDACCSLALNLPVDMAIQALQNGDATNIEMLRICRSDNSWMGALLLHAARPSDALYFTQRWLEADETPRGSGIDFAPPRRTPMTAPQLERAQDCRARQYLHTAVRYPTVLIKVIGKSKRPIDLETHPTRQFNGREDAQD
ncbi:hypothetical protein GGX14DRAFT_555431 [Mycena pura]|uniref:Uncharacterized protein n=1 Tax=Mycena pura TaxID=153505 RepID=A0AAD6YQX9_9AGAR|nr:hypothetical protein GGX14DRAFT_581212 [Mycena pura]KAJ7226841.1 hypothetical protein GGX14DRAFT_555431 [Mycena pura]